LHSHVQRIRHAFGYAVAASREEAIMFRILVLYGTTEGHTAKVAAAIADTIESSGASCDVFEAGPRTPGPEGYDGVIVAASVHAGGYQRPVVAWTRRHSGLLNATPGAFVSVCLGVLQKDPKVERDLQQILGRFLSETGFRPRMTTMVAGALAYSKYSWYVRWIMKRIAAKAGGDTDTSRDYEYTDWNALSRFTVQFVRLVEVESYAPRGVAASA